jgi:hypothetical protein
VATKNQEFRAHFKFVEQYWMQFGIQNDSLQQKVKALDQQLVDYDMQLNGVVSIRQGNCTINICACVINKHDGRAFRDKASGVSFWFFDMRFARRFIPSHKLVYPSDVVE